MTWLEVLITAVSSAGLSGIAVKILHRSVDRATAEKIRAEARLIASQSATNEVNALRGILDDFRTADARKSEHIESLERRIDKLEERERHMLTRAAVHEAWDQLAFQYIATHDANFPPPPPLTARRITAGHDEDTHQLGEHHE